MARRSKDQELRFLQLNRGRLLSPPCEYFDAVAPKLRDKGVISANDLDELYSIDKPEQYRRFYEVLEKRCQTSGIPVFAELVSAMESTNTMIRGLETLEIKTHNFPKVVDKLQRASDSWYYLGLQLKVPVDILDEIRSHHSSPRECLRLTLDKWRERICTPSWETVTHALKARTVGETRLATELEGIYGVAEVCTPTGSFKMQLEIIDLGMVLEAVYPIVESEEHAILLSRARGKTFHFSWFYMGLQLRVSVAKLEEIESRFVSIDEYGDVRDSVLHCFCEVLKHWLRQSSPPPTWRVLVDALITNTVGQNKFAKRFAYDLERTYCLRKAVATTSKTTEGSFKIQLEIIDLGMVLEAVYPIVESEEHAILLFRARGKTFHSNWFYMGLQLRVSVAKLQDIESRFMSSFEHGVVRDSVLHCFCEVLKHWLQQSSPTPTWRVLVDALKTNTVSQKKLAYDLEATYCLHEAVATTSKTTKGSFKMQLEIIDLGMILEAVYPIVESEEDAILLSRARKKAFHSSWFYMGLQLRVSVAKLEEIESRFVSIDEYGDVRDSVLHCFCEVLKHWLQQSSPPPTWRVLVDALKTNTVGKRILAYDLERTYCLHEAVATTSKTTKGSFKMQLEIIDLGMILEAVYPIVKFEEFPLSRAREKAFHSSWFYMGLQLRVSVAKLEEIESRFVSIDEYGDVRDSVLHCFCEVLKHWLRQSSPPPTWRALVDALKTNTVGQNKFAKKLAYDLEETYCLHKAVATTSKTTKGSFKMQLEIIDLGMVLEAVYPIVEFEEFPLSRDRRVPFHSSWFYMGLQLRVSVAKLEEIESRFMSIDEYGDVRDSVLHCLCEVLKHWLQQSSPTPTWRVLVDALKTNTVSQKKLAYDLERTYCLHEAVATTSKTTEGSFKMQLDISDLGMVLEAVYPVVKSRNFQWYRMGQELRIPMSILNDIERRFMSPDEQHMSSLLCEVLKHWLQQSSPPPTWRALADALKTVDEKKLADNLERTYCLHEAVATTSKTTEGGEADTAFRSTQEALRPRKLFLEPSDPELMIAADTGIQKPQPATSPSKSSSQFVAGTATTDTTISSDGGSKLEDVEIESPLSSTSSGGEPLLTADQRPLTTDGGPIGHMTTADTGDDLYSYESFDEAESYTSESSESSDDEDDDGPPTLYAVYYCRKALEETNHLRLSARLNHFDIISFEEIGYLLADISDTTFPKAQFIIHKLFEKGEDGVKRFWEAIKKAKLKDILKDAPSHAQSQCDQVEFEEFKTAEPSIYKAFAQMKADENARIKQQSDNTQPKDAPAEFFHVFIEGFSVKDHIMDAVYASCPLAEGVAVTPFYDESLQCLVPVLDVWVPPETSEQDCETLKSAVVEKLATLTHPLQFRPIENCLQVSRVSISDMLEQRHLSDRDNVDTPSSPTDLSPGEKVAMRENDSLLHEGTIGLFVCTTVKFPAMHHSEHFLITNAHCVLPSKEEKNLDCNKFPITAKIVDVTKKSFEQYPWRVAYEIHKTVMKDSEEKGKQQQGIDCCPLTCSSICSPDVEEILQKGCHSNKPQLIYSTHSRRHEFKGFAAFKLGWFHRGIDFPLYPKENLPKSPKDMPVNVDIGAVEVGPIRPPLLYCEFPHSNGQTWEVIESLSEIWPERSERKREFQVYIYNKRSHKPGNIRHHTGLKYVCTHAKLLGDIRMVWLDGSSQPPFAEEGSQPPFAEEGSQPPFAEEGSQTPFAEKGSQTPFAEKGDSGSVVYVQKDSTNYIFGIFGCFVREKNLYGASLLNPGLDLIKPALHYRTVRNFRKRHIKPKKEKTFVEHHGGMKFEARVHEQPDIQGMIGTLKKYEENYKSCRSYKFSDCNAMEKATANLKRIYSSLREDTCTHDGVMLSFHDEHCLNHCARESHVRKRMCSAASETLPDEKTLSLHMVTSEDETESGVTTVEETSTKPGDQEDIIEKADVSEPPGHPQTMKTSFPDTQEGGEPQYRVTQTVPPAKHASLPNAGKLAPMGGSQSHLINDTLASTNGKKSFPVSQDQQSVSHTLSGKGKASEGNRTSSCNPGSSDSDSEGSDPQTASHPAAEPRQSSKNAITRSANPKEAPSMLSLPSYSAQPMVAIGLTEAEGTENFDTSQQQSNTPSEDEATKQGGPGSGKQSTAKPLEE